MDSPGATFILLSYARPANMQRIVDAITRSGACRSIHLSNNRPETNIDDYVSASDDRISIVTQPTDSPPWIRWQIARDIESRFFVCIDDDVFLEPDQIDALVERLARDPSQPHGVWGQNVYDYDGQYSFRPVHHVDAEVSIINSVYACTDVHVRRFFEIAEKLGIATSAQSSIGDDLVISAAGGGYPMCHDLGVLRFCPTSNDETIALCRKPGFAENRLERWLRLREIVPRRAAAFRTSGFARVPFGA